MSEVFWRGSCCWPPRGHSMGGRRVAVSIPPSKGLLVRAGTPLVKSLNAKDEVRSV